MSASNKSHSHFSNTTKTLWHAQCASHAHAHVHTHAHTYRHTHIQTRTTQHTHTHNTHTHNTHMHTNKHTHTLTHTHVSSHLTGAPKDDSFSVGNDVCVTTHVSRAYPGGSHTHHLYKLSVCVLLLCVFMCVLYACALQGAQGRYVWTRLLAI